MQVEIDGPISGSDPGVEAKFSSPIYRYCSRLGGSITGSVPNVEVMFDDPITGSVPSVEVTFPGLL